jgi:abortive infection bacteriophage resistance protein
MFYYKNRLEVDILHSSEKRAANFKRMLNPLLGVKAGSWAFTNAKIFFMKYQGSFLKHC